jgi:hypothetical protein
VVQTVLNAAKAEVGEKPGPALQTGFLHFCSLGPHHMKRDAISSTEALLRDLLSRRILILDGAMGTMIQQYKLTKKIIAASALPISQVRQGAVRQGQQ